MRYPLTTGRRVNPLRLNPIVTEQDVLLVLDPALPPAQQEAWKEVAGTERCAGSADQLRSALAAHSPDLLCWVGGLENGSLVLGEERIAPAELRRMIDEAKEGNPEPLVFLQVAESSQALSWPDFLGQASSTLPGLVTWEAPQAAMSAEASGRELLARLLVGGRPVGEVLRDLRGQQGWPALALAAFCPPQVQFGQTELGASGETPGTEAMPGGGVLYALPEEPYKPFAALDREDRPLLAGRDRDIIRFAGLLDEPSTGLIFLHGGFGVGKTSFVRTGVVSYLEDTSLGYLVLRDRSPAEEETPVAEGDYPVVAVRAGLRSGRSAGRGFVPVCPALSLRNAAQGHGDGAAGRHPANNPSRKRQPTVKQSEPEA